MIFIVYAATNSTTAPYEMGLADYSYHFVLESFRPVLERMGSVVQVFDAPQISVDAVYDVATAHGESCIFLSFTPPHKTQLHLRCPTVPVFAWEYHDLPRRVHQSISDDWCFVLRSLGSAITHSEASAELVRQALGADFPIAVIKAPLFDAFARSPGEPPASPLLEREVFEILGHVEEAPRAGGVRAKSIAAITHNHGAGNRGVGNRGAGNRGDGKHGPANRQASGDTSLEWQPSGGRYELALEGVVYLSVFNPGDGRKNWREIVKCFALALGDRPDVTLVLKTIQVGPGQPMRHSFHQTLKAVEPLRCRIILLDGYLDDATYQRLIQSATFSVNASHGEGQCLPLMEAMAAGRPAVAPPHTGMADYVNPSNAFCVGSSLEPTIIPHDPSGKLLTWQHRIDARSLYDAFLDSYRVATEKPERYGQMAHSARESLERLASEDACEAALRSFLSSREDAGVAKVSTRDTRVDIDQAFRRQLLRLVWSNRQRRQWTPDSDPSSGPIDGVPLHFILAGFAKCGTTSLSVLLDSHPDLYIRREENWHFSPGFGHADDYFKFFFDKALGGQRLGLCGVGYSSAKDEAIAREAVLRHYPDVRLLFIARDPLARIESAYREYHHSWHRTAAQIPPFDVTAALQQNPVLVDDCRYGARLSHYTKRMRSENVHVLFFEDLLNDPGSVLRECYNFLGVDASVPVPLSPPRLNAGSQKLRDTEALRALLDLTGEDRHVATALRVLSLEERDQLAIPLGLREPHPEQLPGWGLSAQRRFVQAIEPDVRAFLDATGRSLDIWPRFASFTADGEDGRSETLQ